MSSVQNRKNKFPRKDAVIDVAEKLLAAAGDASIDFSSEYRRLADSYIKLYRKFCKTIVISDSYEQQTKDLSVKLEKTLYDFQKLKEVALPLCIVCQKIHTVDDLWIKQEVFFAKHADIMFSHGICPTCVKQTYGKLGEQMLAHQTKVEERNNRLQKSVELRADDSLKEMHSLVEQAVSGENPLAQGIEKIVNSYTKLLRRFEKIVSISDSYQLQLREFNLRLELMAHIDPLTSIYNRGYFMALLNTELSRASRNDRKLSLLILDMDKFKKVNDIYGHYAGDEVLRSLSRIIQTSGLRNSDFFGRIGGEEFAICLPETDIHGAEKVAEKIRVTLEETPVILKKNELFTTASIGISEYRAGDTEDTLLHRADQAMYRAKKGGRNKVCLWKT